MSSTLENVCDLRSWLALARELGEVYDVRGADWDTEIGAVSELNYRKPNPPALLFDDIKGYPSGARVLTSSLSSSRRMAATLRLGTDLDDAALISQLRSAPARWLKEAPGYEPTDAGDGPILGNVLTGDDINLLDFPVPFWHPGDGGRFIGTGCAVFTSDPNTHALNVGAYRMQVQNGGRSASINMEAGKHGAMHVREWFAKEGRAPVTVSLGHDPLFLIVAGTEVPLEVSELNYAGAVCARPESVIYGELTGLPIPAGSELALEGWLYPSRSEPEGPFGEWTGYYSQSPAPILTLDPQRLYFRDNPILLGAPPGRPPHDYSYMRSVFKSALIHEGLSRCDLPGLQSVWAHESGGGRLLVAVAIKQRYPGHSRQAAYLTSQLPSAAYMNRFVVVVDSDIDPRNLNDVVWAICTRCDPGIDLEVMRRTWGSRVDPLRSEEGPAYNSRAVIDACRPYDRLDSFPAVCESTDQTVAAVVDKWPDLLR